jgi:hypothetical protein
MQWGVSCSEQYEPVAPTPFEHVHVFNTHSTVEEEEPSRWYPLSQDMHFSLLSVGQSAVPPEAALPLLQ